MEPEAPSDEAGPPLDVLLVHHPTSNPHRPVLVPAVGLLSLAEQLDRHGIRAQVVNLAVEALADPGFDPLAYAARTGARVLGLSVHWFFQLPDSLELARQAKQRSPGLLVVLGGFTASLFARELVTGHPEVDVVVRGDGELPLVELCRAHLSGDRRAWAAVPNLVYRDEGGMPHETPFTHVMDAAQLGDLRPTRLDLLKNRDAAAALAVRLTPKKFRERFDFERKSFLCLGPTRGCVHTCALCGGNLRAQERAFHRSRPVFQPLPTVLASIREAMEFGYGNFYVSADPEPNGPYYFELFRAIRQAGLEVNLLFDSWSLPSEAFVEDFRRTFRQGMISVSPESADEEVRRRTKGPLAYSNEELDARLDFIWSRDLVTQVFFGFFLPGDTPGTMRRTRRLVHELENERSEAFYLAFSTDPFSPVVLEPERHGMHTRLRTLEDYLEALPRERLSANLIGHRPASMSADEADGLALWVEVDQLLAKVLPLGTAMLRSLERTLAPGVPDEEERLLDALVADVKAHGGIPASARLAERVLAELVARGRPEPGWRALRELVRFEGLPYRLMEQHFGGVGRHYTSVCAELPGTAEARRAFVEAAGAATAREHFALDVLELAVYLQTGGPLEPLLEAPWRPVDVRFAVDRGARFVAVEEPA